MTFQVKVIWSFYEWRKKNHELVRTESLTSLWIFIAYNIKRLNILISPFP